MFGLCGAGLGALLVFGPRAVGGVFLAFLAANALFFHGETATHLVLLSAGGTLQCLLAAAILRRIPWEFRIPSTAAEAGIFLGVVAGIFSAGAIFGGDRWLGDLSGVLLLTPGIWIYGTRRIGPTRPFPALFPLVALSAGICLLGYLHVRTENESRVRHEFSEIANSRMAALRLGIERRLLLLRGVQSLFDASHEVEPREFRAFIAPWIVEDPALASLGWFPKRGDPAPDPLLGRAIEAAARGGEITASGTIRLPPDARGIEEEAIVLSVPIFREGRRDELLGVAAGIYRLRPFFDPDLYEVSMEGPSVDLFVYDRTAGADDSLLGFFGGEVPTESRLRYSKEVEVAGRRWEFLFVPSPGTYEKLRTRQPEILLLGGISFTLLLTVLLEGLRKRSEIVERIVADRTEELHRSEELLAKAQRIAALGSAKIDLASGRLEVMTPYLRTLLVGGEDLFFSVHPDDRERIRRELEAGTRGVWREIQTRFRTAAAPAAEGERWIEMRVCASREAEMLPIAIFRDITRETFRLREAADFSAQIQRQNRDLAERDKMLEALLDDLSGAQEDLEERSHSLAESNRELEQFAYVASHDLQEPLRAIKAFSQSLARRLAGRLDAKEEECLRLIVDGVRRMESLIRDLLTYSKVGRRKLVARDFSAKEALDTAFSNLQTKIQESGAEIRVGELPRVVVDPGELVRLFQNLIANAIAYRSARPPRVEIRALRTEGGWRFEVQDNGIGIDPPQQDRIFDVFTRLHSQAEIPGTGMGLAIAKRIVQRRNGRIGVLSEPGEGSTFFFTIPDEFREMAA